MESKDFKYIQTVAETKNFTKAANALYISQPSLSRYIKNIEKKWDSEFFDRTSSPLEITEAGKLYLEYADQVLSLEEKLRQNLNTLKTHNSEAVRIGVPFVMGEYILPKLVSFAMKRKSGPIQISSSIGFTDDLIAMLQQGKIDLTIAGKDVLLDSGYRVEVLTYDPVYIIGLKSSPLLQNYDTKKADLKHPLTIDFQDIKEALFGIGKPNMTLYELAREYLAEREVGNYQQMEVASLPVNFELALNGECFSFVIASMIKYSYAPFRDLLCPISCEDLKIPICLAYSEDSCNRNSSIRSVVDWLRETYRGKEI